MLSNTFMRVKFIVTEIALNKEFVHHNLSKFSSKLLSSGLPLNPTLLVIENKF